MKSYYEFVRLHKSKGDGLRLGQRFCNMYIKNSWPELYYAEDQKAAYLIFDWLVDHNYIEELPNVVEQPN